MMSEFFHVVNFKRNQILRKLEKRGKRVVILYTSYKKRAFANKIKLFLVESVSQETIFFFCVIKLITPSSEFFLSSSLTQ